jgi:hypothetical protein
VADLLPPAHDVALSGSQRLDARAAAEAEATHWQRLGMTAPATETDLAEGIAAEAGTAKAMFEAADAFDAAGDMHGRAVASKLRELAVLAHALEAARLRSGIRAENAHLLYDADADAVTRPFTYLGKGISARLIDGGQS